MRLARFNRRVTNRVAMRIAGRVPGFGVVRHVGRRSGTVYRTPIATFERGGVRVIALTYGAGADWVRNVLAAEGCVLETRTGTVRLTEPRVVVDPDNRWAPLPVRVILRGLGSTEHLRLVEGVCDKPREFSGD